MSKLVWTFDPDTKQLVGNGKEMADEYQLAANETLVAPSDGFAPYTFDGTKWVGSTFDEWRQSHPNIKDPSVQYQINAQLTKQLAVATKTAEIAQSAVVALTKQLAAQAKEA
jgi:hypothetical protein